jgi:hypothetical protein
MSDGVPAQEQGLRYHLTSQVRNGITALPIDEGLDRQIVQ